MTTESCTSSSQMTTRNLRAMCPNLKNNNNELLPVDRWEVSSSNAPGLNGLYFSFIFDGYLYFRISAYAALKMNVAVRWSNKSYTSLWHNITQGLTWPITYREWTGDKSPAPRAPINRLGKKNSFHFNIERRQSLHLFNFYLVVLFLRKYKELLIQQRKRIFNWNSLFFFPVISRSFFTEKLIFDPWLKWRKSRERAKKPSKKRPYQITCKRRENDFSLYRSITLPFFIVKEPALFGMKLVCLWLFRLAKQIAKWWVNTLTSTGLMQGRV